MKSLINTLLAIILLSGCQAQTNEQVNCWRQAYAPDFQFIEALDQLEKQLVSLAILKGTSWQDYKVLSENLSNNVINEEQFKKISTPKYVSKKPFLQCNDNPSKDQETLKYALLFSIYQTRASDLATIQITVPDNDTILLNLQETQLAALKEKLIAATKELQRKHIPLDEIIISMEVAGEVNMGLIADIQQILRETDLTKVSYSKME